MLVFSSNIQIVNGHHVKNIKFRNLKLCSECAIDRNIWMF